MKKVTRINAGQGFSPARNKPKLKTAAYCRVSTDSSEQMDSFSAQVKHYTDYINANSDWTFAGIYADSGISGTKKDIRPDFLRLISDCEARKIDFIITKSISRFARNTTDCLEVIRRFTELGIGVYFEKENINTLKTDSELMLSILSSLASSESVSISQNSKWGIKKRFANGTYKLANPPYGYDYDGQTLIPNEVQSKIVKRIFSEILAGFGTRAIALRLNAEGIPPQRCNKWTAHVIRGITENEKYIGDVLHQKTYTDDKFMRHLNDGVEDMYYLSDHHEPIISKADFEAVKLIIAQRGIEKGNDGDRKKYQSRYTFSGKIICGECGSNFKRRVHLPNKPNTYIAWGCTNHIDTNGRDCSMIFIRDEFIKSAFITMMNKLYSNKNIILKPLLDGLKQSNSNNTEKELESLQIKTNEILEQVQVLTGLMSKGYLEPALFNEQKSKLQAELDSLKQQKTALQQNADGGRSLILETEELFRYFNKEGTIVEEFYDELFIRFAEGIIVFTPTEIGFKLKNGLCLRERIAR